jgi:hypothetical protein
MLQVDGSPHDWLEGRGPSLCLIGAIDDATGEGGRSFVRSGEFWSYFRLFSEIFNKHGLPQSVYARTTNKLAHPGDIIRPRSGRPISPRNASSAQATIRS